MEYEFSGFIKILKPRLAFFNPFTDELYFLPSHHIGR
jgi:hypothetical protein